MIGNPHYLATFEAGTGDVCQGLVHFPAGPRRKNFYPERWFHTIARLTLARTGIPGCQVSLRTSLRGGELDQLAFFYAPAAAEQQLRRYLASFLELLALTDGSVLLPVDRIAHDSLAEPWARHLCRIEPECYTAGNAWLVCDFRVFDFIPELLEEAAALGHDILHQVHLHAFALSPEHERRARRNFAALEYVNRVPTETLEIQRRLLNRSAGEVTLMEEYVGATSAAGVDWLQYTLGRHFETKFGPAKFETPQFLFQDNRFAKFLNRGSDLAEAVATGFHTNVFKAPVDAEIFSAAVNSSFASSVFLWSGPLKRWFEPRNPTEKTVILAAYNERESMERNEAIVAAAQMAKEYPSLRVCDRVVSYAFISYRRAEFTRIAPILHKLDLAGFPFWFDRGIPGGTDWLGELQDRIQQARVLLLFLSRASSESRYVQLEIRYAFTLARPILPVRLEYIDLASLPGGLGLVCNSIQMIDFRVEEITRSLRHYGL